MERHTPTYKILLGVLGMGTAVLSSFAIAQITRLHLPIPLVYAIANFIIPAIALLAVVVTSRLAKSRYASIFKTLAPATILVPFAFLVLAFVYGVPSDLRSCAAERQWLRYFRNHDQAIRVIQDRLRCCGFNSIRDRAWPFPAIDVDAGACQRDLGYTTPCRDLWLRQESTVAGTIGFTSLLNCVLLVLLSINREGSLVRQTVSSTYQRLLVENQEEPVAFETYEDAPARAT